MTKQISNMNERITNCQTVWSNLNSSHVIMRNTIKKLLEEVSGIWLLKIHSKKKKPTMWNWQPCLICYRKELNKIRLSFLYLENSPKIRGIFWNKSVGTWNRLNNYCYRVEKPRRQQLKYNSYCPAKMSHIMQSHL